MHDSRLKSSAGRVNMKDRFNASDGGDPVFKKGEECIWYRRGGRTSSGAQLIPVTFLGLIGKSKYRVTIVLQDGSRRTIEPDNLMKKKVR